MSYIRVFQSYSVLKPPMIGIFLYRFSENFIRSTLKENWKVCIDLRVAKGQEGFYRSLGFQSMSESETGSGMEKMLEG